MGHSRHLKLVSCPGCHHIMKIPFSLIGKTFHCPKCDKKLKIMSRVEKNKISVQSKVENHVQVQIKNLPEKHQTFVKLVKKMLKKIKNVYRLW